MKTFGLRIQVLPVPLVVDDLTTICPDLLLLIPLSRFSHKALPLTVPISDTESLCYCVKWPN